MSSSTFITYHGSGRLPNVHSTGELAGCFFIHSGDPSLPLGLYGFEVTLVNHRNAAANFLLSMIYISFICSLVRVRAAGLSSSLKGLGDGETVTVTLFFNKLDGRFRRDRNAYDPEFIHSNHLQRVVALMLPAQPEPASSLSIFSTGQVVH